VERHQTVFTISASMIGSSLVTSTAPCVIAVATIQPVGGVPVEVHEAHRCCGHGRRERQKLDPLDLQRRFHPRDGVTVQLDAAARGEHRDFPAAYGRDALARSGMDGCSCLGSELVGI